MKPSPNDPERFAGEQLRVRYDSRLPVVLDDVSLVIPEGKITVLVGPNGSGKSTLLNTLARQLRAEAGTVIIDGRELHMMSARELALTLGVLFQEHAVPGDLSVEELVHHGRYPHSGFLQSPDASDHEAVEKALRLANVTELRHRPVGKLSGGQRQLAWVAMALAQETPYLFLDEPTTFLDLAHQFDLMDLVRRLNRELGKTILMVLHDLNLAARYGDHLVALKDGKIAAQGSPAEMLTAEILREVFEVNARIVSEDGGKTLYCVPEGRAGK
ncbi:ABC transporter ATP-binding protein [Luteolibacter marinus]|uniref:ABC transporter ATP-binding protein n=1 Tax=Luteolibacter marinus TaxID=2776705 RepID=UPI001868EC30|nr:ABC transporter ATP-binding protein [Luteolibacter marinus]